MIRSLLWKESREHLPKLLGVFGFYAGLIFAIYLWGGRETRGTATTFLALPALLVPGFIAMGTVTEEHSRRTFATLQALPFPIGRALLAKIICGTLTITLPLIAMACLIPLFLTNGPQDIAIPLSPLFIASLVEMTISLYIFTVAVTIRLRSELMVALTYVGILIFIQPLTFIVTIFRVPTFRYLLAAMSPWGFFTASTQNALDWNGILLITLYQLLFAIILVSIAMRLYGDTGEKLIKFPIHLPFPSPSRPTAATALISAPFHARQINWSPLRFPILWKTWREVRWFAGTLLALESLFALAAAWGLYIHGWSGPGGNNAGILPLLSPQSLSYLPLIPALFVGLILGTEIGIRDSDPHTNLFWRSRAIQLKSYARRRFSVGLLLAITLVAIVPLTILLTTLPWEGFGEFGYRLTARSSARDVLILSLPIQILTYSLGVFCGTLTSRRVLALLLAGASTPFLCLFLIQTLNHFIPESFRTNPNAIHTQALFTALIALIATTTLLAWLSTLSITANWKQRLDAGLAFPFKSVSPAGSLRA